MDRSLGRSRRIRTALLGLVCLAGAACAGMQPFDPTQPPSHLAPEDGILLLRVENDVPLSSLRVIGRAFAEVATDLEPGKHWLFLVAPEGRYRIHRFDHGILYWLLDSDDERINFTVEPGRINYAGTFQVGLDGMRARYRIANLTATDLLPLVRAHEELFRRYPPRHARIPRDDFLELYLATPLVQGIAP